MTLDLSQHVRDGARGAPFAMPSSDVPAPMVPVTVTPLTDCPDGPRVVTMPTSGLLVGVAPVAKTAWLTARPSFAVAAYACLSHGGVAVPGLDVRPGESLLMSRRLAEHLALPPCPVEEIVLVGPADPTFGFFGRDETRALEWLLHRLAVEAGRATVHGTAPPRPALLGREPQRLARWISDLGPMLRAAGTPAFAPLGPTVRPVAVDAGSMSFRAVRRGFATQLPAGLTERSHTCHYEFTWRGLAARATVSGSWHVLHAGSTAAPVASGGVQPCIEAKRRRMLAAGVLQRGPAGLLRLTRDVAMPSLLNMFRTLSGTNEFDHPWRFVPTPARRPPNRRPT